MKRIYIAGPFFNEEQKRAVGSVEEILISLDKRFYSPSLHGRGVITDMTPSERLLAANGIFKDNIREMDNCDLVIAITDDYDPGTMFEIGYFFCQKKPIITYSPNGYASNVMIAKSAIAHYTRILSLRSDMKNDQFVGDNQEITS